MKKKGIMFCSVFDFKSDEKIPVKAEMESYKMHGAGRSFE
jgi:hypothetical protein